ncbi:MAG: FIST C-terminal domain-containing protein [Planctomycetes bacterium]|nr:FIST C-terminal domain-containing protein [Planctomycetota bacterium]
MTFCAHSLMSTAVNSAATGRDLAERLAEGLTQTPKTAIVYATTNHDAEALLGGINDVLGPDTAVVGCSTQGVMSRGQVLENGYVAGLMGIGGDGVEVGTARADDIVQAPRDKGRALGTSLLAGMNGSPRVVVVYYDPICGADIGALLDGLSEVVTCPVIGAGAGQDFGPMVATFQYLGRDVRRGAAVALALGGAVGIDMGACHGTDPVGVCMQVTKADGPTLLELDGRPAVEVWAELCGEADPQVEHAANMAIGLPREMSPQDVCRVLAPFGTDRARGGIVMHTSVAVGTEVMFHHRAEEGVRAGTRAMATDLVSRLGERRPRAVLGFECGARTAPFLGAEATLAENIELQQALAPEAAWLGMLAWGEVYPLHRGSAVFNFTYPLLCLGD